MSFPSVRTDCPPRVLFLAVALSLFCCHAALGDAPAIAWTEDFSTDPVAAGRFSIRPAEFAARFAYHGDTASLTAHIDTSQPTVWYMQPVGRTLSRSDDFEFSVSFRIHSSGFIADPWGFAQIAWGLINSQSTGPDRAGFLEDPNLYPFDCVTFDYFPNVNPVWGGPTVCPTILYGDDGDGSYPNVSFAQSLEGMIDTGDETLALDTLYTARVVYDGLAQVATLTIRTTDRFLMINAQGTGGYGGPDGDPTTIQTFAEAAFPNDFDVDSFAIAAWLDSYCEAASVIADVDFFRVELSAPAMLLGDVNHDGNADGRDIEPFLLAMLAPNPSPGAVARSDFTGNGVVDFADVQPFVERLTQP